MARCGGWKGAREPWRELLAGCERTEEEEEEGTDADEVKAVEALSRDDGYELGFAEKGHFGGRERTGAGEGSGGCHCGWVVG